MLAERHFVEGEFRPSRDGELRHPNSDWFCLFRESIRAYATCSRRDLAELSFLDVDIVAAANHSRPTVGLPRSRCLSDTVRLVREGT